MHTFPVGGGGGGGGANMGYLKKKEGGRSCKQRQGEHWKTMFKISLVILRGARLTQGGMNAAP